MIVYRMCALKMVVWPREISKLRAHIEENEFALLTFHENK
jgi:hypothetical protein